MANDNFSWNDDFSTLVVTEDTFQLIKHYHFKTDGTKNLFSFDGITWFYCFVSSDNVTNLLQAL